jgi:acid phosphatase (class A)
MEALRLLLILPGIAPLDGALRSLSRRFAPDRAQSILERGREFGESRAVCAVHFPSDVAAGEIVATAVVEQLHTVPEFTRDLTCAHQEYRAAVQPSAQLSSECTAMEKSLSTSQRAE